MIRRLVRDVVFARRQLARVSREESHLSLHYKSKPIARNEPARETLSKTKHLQALRSKLLFRKIPIVIARVERKLPRNRRREKEGAPLTAKTVTLQELSTPTTNGEIPAESRIVPKEESECDRRLAESGKTTTHEKPNLLSADVLQLISSIYIFEEHRNRFVRQTIREAERRIEASDKEMKLRTSALMRQRGKCDAVALKDLLESDDHYMWHRDRRDASRNEIAAIRSSIVARPFMSAKLWYGLANAGNMMFWLSDGAVPFALSVVKILPRLCLMMLRQSVAVGGVINKSSPRFVVSLSSRRDESSLSASTDSNDAGKSKLGVRLLPRPAKDMNVLAIETLITFAEVILPFFTKVDSRLLASSTESAAVLEGFVALQQIATALLVLVTTRDEQALLQDALSELDEALFRASSTVAIALAEHQPSLSAANAARTIAALNSLTILDPVPRERGGESRSFVLVDYLLRQLFPALSNNTMATLMAKARNTSIHSFMSRGHRSKLRRARQSMMGERYKLSPIVEARIAQRKLKAAFREGRLQQVLDKSLTDLAETTTLTQMRGVFATIAQYAPVLNRESSQRAVFGCGWVGEVITMQLTETKRSLGEGISLGEATSMLLMCTSLIPLERQLSTKNGASSTAHHRQLRGFAEVLCATIIEQMSARLEALQRRLLPSTGGKSYTIAGEEDDNQSDSNEDEGDSDSAAASIKQPNCPSLAELSYISSAISEIAVGRAGGQLDENAKSVAQLMKQLFLSDEEVWKQIPHSRTASQQQKDRLAAISDMFSQLGLLDSALTTVFFGDHSHTAASARLTAR